MKKNIAIVTGGYSGEAVISYKTAQTAIEHMDKNLFEAFLVDIRRDGWWVKYGNKEIAIDKNDFGFVLAERKVTFDCAYLALHGTPGEDGKLQAYFDMIGLPYNSGNTLNLSLTFNKKFTTSVLGMMGFGVAKSLLLRINERETAFAEIVAQLTFPLFVKPNNGGSSIGISKVNRVEELQTALDKAYKEDAEIIVEEFLIGKEYTCGVTYYQNKITALPITEILSENEFFDFEAKYEGKSKEITPADLSFENTLLIQQTAERIYKSLECKGNIRIDFILGEKGLFVIEVNTIPGMSSASIVPQQLAIAGIPLTEVITNQLHSAMNYGTR